jgi:hypothetical protein
MRRDPIIEHRRRECVSPGTEPSGTGGAEFKGNVMPNPKVAMGAAVILMLGWSAVAFPCTLARRKPTPTELVDQAEVIVRARAERQFPAPADWGDDRTPGRSETHVSFAVLSVIKGRRPDATLSFDGWLVPDDERNPGPVPYTSARHSADGPCITTEYRAGGEYLLFLRRGGFFSPGAPDALTPYWANLVPVNEQVFGDADPWEIWVRRQLGDRR